MNRRHVLLSAAGTSAAAGVLSSGCSRRAATPAGVVPLDLDLLGAAEALHSGSLSPVALTDYCLDRIARFDGELNAFITVMADQALADARRAAEEIARGQWRGPLHGIPLALKDNIDTAGVRTTAASGVFAERVPEADADIVARLKKAGAVLLGKLNLHEFAFGTTSAISHFGPVHNPWDLERSAGGSSGGCGAAVAAGLCFGAIGTDTGGSVRIPAAACGIVGLKPTHDVVSLGGIVPISASFDTVGPLCRTVADAAVLFRALTDHPVAQAADPAALPPVAALRVGRVRNTDALCNGAVDAEVQAVFDAAVERLGRLVAGVQEVEVSIPAHFSAILLADAYAYHRPWLAGSAQYYDARTRTRIQEGESVDPALYLRLRDELRAWRAQSSSVFVGVDALVLPTLPQPPVRLRDATDPFAIGACTFPFNVVGGPAISIPCGFTASGLPVGLLLAGPAFSEPTLLALAQAYEQATPWHERHPPGPWSVESAVASSA
ncbi:MAG: amidase [Steroidobacteraceae bacterium]|nr:amidase [Nevskiaceae bacterium]MCP5339451.1 amidase [Nevskiaceae bacterium]MCP5360564.1 amidase [Nevskiaceae bacterium]MCP5472911.1 amidase [Nevskiaceae bacterium]